ncbi:MAG: cytochrome P450 [Gaiellales bacterium]
MTVALDLSDVDIASPEVYEQGIPHEAFGLLRERDPVHWHPWEWSGGGFWAITRYEDVISVAKSWETFSSAKGHIYLWELEGEALEVRRSMIETDPPDHTRLRRIVSSAFTPRRVRDYEDYTRGIASRLLDDVLAKGEVDLVEALTAPMPINVLVSIFGVPDEDAPYMIELTDHLVEGTSGRELDPSAYGNTTPLHLLPFNSPASWALFEYGRKLGEARRGEEGDDLVTRLVNAEWNGERLTDAEYCNFFQLLAFAGNETTRTAMSQGLLALMQYPEQYARLVADPELVPQAVEEILRWASPVLCFRRTATCDTEIRGVPIAEGDKVVMWYVSANFDEDVFADPHTFDVGRDERESTSFGIGGPHYCLGAWLARLEIRVLLEEILRRGLRFELAGEPVRIRSNFVNGLHHLPARVSAG